MDCWETLELEPGSDERSIKRQYARLLKNTRPDSSPEAFQVLREAYEIALNWARWATDHKDDEDDAFQPTDSGFQEISSSPLPELILPAPTTPSLEENLLAELLTDLSPSSLAEHSQKAEEARLSSDFERSVLQQCLDDAPAPDLLDAACHEFGWLEARAEHHLNEAERLPLYEQLLSLQLAELQRLHDHGEPQALPEGLKCLLQQPWLQSYDSRALLENALVNTLLEMPAWSAQTLDAVAAVMGWIEGKSEPNCPEYQWRNLLERWDSERFYTELTTAAQSRKTTAECRAARLIMAPFDRFQRRRFIRDLSPEELHLGTGMASKMVNLHPQLLERLPGAPLDGTFWRDVTPQAPWLSRTQFLWGVLCIVFFAIQHWVQIPFDNGIIIFTLMFSAMVAAGLNALLRVYDDLKYSVKRLDYWLAGFLPASWHQHGAGIRPIRHGLMAILVSLLFIKLSGMSGYELWLGSLVLSIAILCLIHLALRKNLIARCAEAISGFFRRDTTTDTGWQ